MDYSKIEIRSIKSEYGNEIIEVNCENTTAIFRIACENRARKNARFDDWHVINVYFDRTNPNDCGSYVSNSIEVSRMTDLCLFVERKSQWILEKMKREKS